MTEAKARTCHPECPRREPGAVHRIGERSLGRLATFSLSFAVHTPNARRPHAEATPKPRKADRARTIPLGLSLSQKASIDGTATFLRLSRTASAKRAKYLRVTVVLRP